jgi:hypothetical protein
MLVMMMFYGGMKGALEGTAGGTHFAFPFLASCLCEARAAAVLQVF